MKKLAFAVLLFCTSLLKLNAQCLQIESIMVDACVPGTNCTNSVSPTCNCEGKNEMIVFKVGALPLTIASLVPTWPNNSFKGWYTPDATSASNVAQLNSTIVKCGFLKEPLAGTLPANSEVMIITSIDMCLTANSFANLQDTLYVLFQNPGNYQGHFANNNNSGTITTVPTGTASPRILTLSYAPLTCTQSVTYDRSLLVNQFGTYGGSAAQNDGSTVQFDAAGNATYVNFGCQAPYIPIVVKVNSNTDMCYNGNLSLTGTVSGPYTTFSWSGGTGSFSNPTALTTTYTPGSGDGTSVTLYLTAQGKCPSNIVKDSVVVSITQAPSPTVTAVPSGTVCPATTVTLSVNAEPGSTYSWSPGSLSGASVTVTPGTSTVYSLAATNSCTTTNSLYTINVFPSPTVTVVNDSICPGATGTLTASGAATYTWNNSANGSSLTDAPVATTQYTVTATDGNGCTASAGGEIFVYTPPSVSIVNDSICPGATGTLTASGALTYTWNNNATGSSLNASPGITTQYTVTGSDMHGCISAASGEIFLFTPPPVSVSSSSICPGGTATLTASGAQTYTWSTSQTGTVIIVNPGANTSYTVSGTDAKGCMNSAVANVTLYSLPNVTATNTTVCKGQSVIISASGATNYLWSTSQTGNSISVTPLSNTSYTVQGTDANGCTNSAVASVTVNIPPSISSSNASYCPGGSATLTAVGAQTYSWSNSLSGGTIVVSPTVTTNYTVTGTDVNGCSNTSISNVTVFTPPAVAVNNAGVCPGGNTTLTATGATTYSWSTGQSGVSINVTSAGNYTVTGIDINSCTASAVSTVTLNPSPVVSVPSATACNNASATLSASGANTYTWSTGQTGANISVPGTAATYTVIGTDVNGCSDTAQVSVTIVLPPVAQVGSATVICDGQSTILSVPAGPYSYTWTGPNGNAGNSNAINAGQAGIYTVTAANVCGSAQAQFTLTVSNPQAGFAPNSITAQAPATFTFSNTSTGMQLSDLWNFGNGAASTQSSPVYTYAGEGAYNVTLIVTDQYGCKDTSEVTVYVTDTLPPIIIPNVFSPNGDLINDIFLIRGSSLSYFECHIYDRWGVEMYKSTDIHTGWDGKNAGNGHTASDGTYYYIVNYIDGKGKAGSKAGYLLLAR